MPCIEIQRPTGARVAVLLAILLTGCGSSRLASWPVPSPNPAPVESRSPSSPSAGASRGADRPDSKAPIQAHGSAGPAEQPTLGAARRARSRDEFRLLAAQRMVAASKSVTYDGAVPEPLLAIPVLEIELHADGSIRRIVVSRTPGQATDTVQIAIEAVKRAAPYGDISHLPKPWKFTEVFLFDDDRRFKPRTLDL